MTGKPVSFPQSMPGFTSQNRAKFGFLAADRIDLDQNLFVITA